MSGDVYAILVVVARQGSEFLQNRFPDCRQSGRNYLICSRILFTEHQLWPPETSGGIVTAYGQSVGLKAMVAPTRTFEDPCTRLTPPTDSVKKILREG